MARRWRHRRGRREALARGTLLLLAASAAWLAAALPGCGGGSSAVVVRVGSGGRDVITRGTFSHWMLVTALRDAEESGYGPSGSLRDVVVPDPPRFQACVRSLVLAGAKDARASLKQTCRRRYAALKAQVLASLMTAEWFFAEGEARGLRVSAAEVEARDARVERNAFKTEQRFQAYLRRGAETEADRRFRSRIKLFSAKIAEQVEGDGPTAERQRRLLGFMKGFARKWAAHTRCSRGYVVAGCREYRGSAPAELALL